MGSTRRAFTDEYKAHAVELVINDGRTIVDVARGIEVHAMTLGKWVKKAKDEGQIVDRPLNTRQALTQSGDIDPSDGVVTIRLDSMPTARATAAIRELCEHLTATRATYPGTDLILRYEIKSRP